MKPISLALSRSLPRSSHLCLVQEMVVNVQYSPALFSSIREPMTTFSARSASFFHSVSIAPSRLPAPSRSFPPPHPLPPRPYRTLAQKWKPWVTPLASWAPIFSLSYGFPLPSSFLLRRSPWTWSTGHYLSTTCAHIHKCSPARATAHSYCTCSSRPHTCIALPHTEHTDDAWLQSLYKSRKATIYDYRMHLSIYPSIYLSIYLSIHLLLTHISMSIYYT